MSNEQISKKIGLGFKKLTVTQCKAALQPSQLPTKKYQITGQSGHQSMMLPTPDPFWGRQHAKKV
jgi:hypothetical protein